ncbi:MAG: DNA helicase PriA [Methanoculleaceae archaeon]
MLEHKCGYQASIYCRRCGRPLEERPHVGLICPHCGRRITVICPGCGQPW